MALSQIVSLIQKKLENGGDVYELVDTLDKYATKQTYTELVKKVIMYNIEGVYEL